MNRHTLEPLKKNTERQRVRREGKVREMKNGEGESEREHDREFKKRQEIITWKKKKASKQREESEGQ